MFNAEDFISGLTARELSELKALLASEEYTRIIEDWETYPTNDDE